MSEAECSLRFDGWLALINGKQGFALRQRRKPKLSA